ncbi:DUF2442 domain-containing protein [soil metagenome]
MHKKIYRVIAFQNVSPYTLAITFDDDSVQTIDFEPILYGPLYGPLRDLTFFSQVRLDPNFHTLVWPNDADFDPETLHDWPRHQAMWIAAAKQWPSESA